MNFARSLLSRVLQGLALVLAVVVLNFVLVHAAPGDPVETIAGASGGMNPELMAQLRAQYGLDKPFLEQYLTFSRWSAKPRHVEGAEIAHIARAAKWCHELFGGLGCINNRNRCGA